MSGLKRLLGSRYFRPVLGLALSLLCLILALQGVRPGEIARALLTANPIWVVLALASVLLNQATKVVRWAVLLRPVLPQVGLLEITNANLGAQLLNAILPVRVGDLSRLAVAAQGSRSKDRGLISDGASNAGEADLAGSRIPAYSGVLGSVVLEKLIDLAAYGILILMALTAIPASFRLADEAPIILGTTAAGGFLLSMLYIYWETIFRRVERLSSRLPAGAQEWLLPQLQSGFHSLEALSWRGGLWAVMISTILGWVLAVTTNLLAARALGMPLSWLQAVVLLAVLQVGITLPAMPVRLGLFEYLCILVLGWFGIDASVGLTYGILLHSVAYLPVILLGLPGIWSISSGRQWVSVRENRR